MKQTDGLVLVDKPAGMTSHDVVNRMRRVYDQKRVGHAGTLDPDATGLLVVGIGRATRLLQFVVGHDKEYVGRIVFGTATDTLDASGEITDTQEMNLDREQVAKALQKFQGDIFQVPPMVSARKIAGRKLYEIARSGKTVEREPRKVHVATIELLEFLPGEQPMAEIRVQCSAGTYIRSLAADVGKELGGYAHLGALRRIRSGPFHIEEAHTIEEVSDNSAECLLSPTEVVRGLPVIELSETQRTAVQHGRALVATEFPEIPDGRIALFAEQRLHAVYEREGSALRAVVVLDY